ncbi:hypothetical protein ACQP2Y_29255 [Actinoplanes sp. CA-051413]|uniref:hypothetical protein n=1 Tax=Actinoplanes sp. CA-051413 TaxID=3239899 RepID=UPI003D997810
MTPGPNRRAAGEVWPLISLWLGLGTYDADGPAVRRGAAFVAVQTVVAVALAAALSLGKAAIVNGDLSRGWLFGLLVPMLPLIAGVARTPPGLAIALTAAVPAGLLTGGLVWLALGTVADGFWLWFAAIAAGALTAGPAFGALARDEPTRP